jgi:hypothetical protein
VRTSSGALETLVAVAGCTWTVRACEHCGTLVRCLRSQARKMTTYDAIDLGSLRKRNRTP